MATALQASKAKKITNAKLKRLTEHVDAIWEGFEFLQAIALHKGLGEMKLALMKGCEMEDLIKAGEGIANIHRTIVDDIQAHCDCEEDDSAVCCDCGQPICG